ncbi:MAG: ACP S-malonyltransferase [Alloprevotella sp.]|nr:ACP S-malonyltransferase [Alloprevotella sp.]
MKAFVFPGQGAQFVGMGKALCETHPIAQSYFEKANEILGFRITDVMFSGTDEELKQTRVTQPAVFLHSVVKALALGDNFAPDMVAGHSLGEFSALTAAGCLTFEDGLRLVATRATAMQRACEAAPGAMAAIIALPDATVEDACRKAAEKGGIVVPANYNCPGQLVISGTKEAVEEACTILRDAGAKRALMLPVGGAFHSPLMQPAKEELEAAIARTEFHAPRCAVYQNVDGRRHTDPEEIKQNLILQLTSSVRWTEEVQNMLADGATSFTECGPGKALQGMIVKIARAAEREVEVNGIED